MADKQCPQSGNIVLGFLIALTTLSLAAMYTTNEAQTSNIATKSAKAELASTTSNQEVISVIAKVKALMAPAKQPNGSVMPVFYSENYYDEKWQFRPGLNSFKSKDGNSALIVSIPKSSVSLSDSQQIMAGNKSVEDLNKTKYSVEVVKTNFDPSATPLVKSVDIIVTNISPTTTTLPRISVAARIPISSPEPLDANLLFRKAGQGPFVRLKNGADLTKGPYEFQLVSSGVAYNAEIKVNGTVMKRIGGFQPGTKRITHRASSYSARNKAIGGRFALNLKGIDTVSSGKSVSSEIKTPKMAAKYFNSSSCTFLEDKFASDLEKSQIVPLSSEVQLEGIVYGPDGKTKKSTGIIKGLVSKTSESPTQGSKPLAGGPKKELTVADYKTICSKECPFSEGFGETASADRKGPHTSDFLMMAIAKVINVTKYKVCRQPGQDINSDKLALPPVVLYDLKTCQPVVLLDNAQLNRNENCEL